MCKLSKQEWSDVLAYIKVNRRTKKTVKHVHDMVSESRLTPSQLGTLFEWYAGASLDDELSSFTRLIDVDDLSEKLNSGFASSNGCQWARADTSYLGRRYIIRKTYSNGRVSGIQLDGANDTPASFRAVRSDILDSIRNESCAILDIGAGRNECDHKNGRYTTLANLSPETQRKSDFQPLSKAANDAKRQHCKECRATGKRYDARNLGYSVPCVAGDLDSKTCAGCYWYDPRKFNEVVSSGFSVSK